MRGAEHREGCRQQNEELTLAAKRLAEPIMVLWKVNGQKAYHG